MKKNKIDSQAILYNVVGTDEAYTPDYGVAPIVPYVKQYADAKGYTSDNPCIVWCPFDLSTSEFVKQLSDQFDNITVTFSHIKYYDKLYALKFSAKNNYVNILSFQYQLNLSGAGLGTKELANGKCFFKYEPKEWHIIVSNPPFQNKRKFFERALSFNKPFALIMTNAWLNDSSSKTVFLESEKQLQLLMFNDRMKFTNPEGRPNNKITFSSSYYCYDLLPKDLILYGDLIHTKKVR